MSFVYHLRIFFGAVAVATVVSTAASRTFYVDASAPAGGNGLSWQSAFNNLQDALHAARLFRNPPHRILVAEGTYYPDDGRRQTNGDRTASFWLDTPNVSILGGYATGGSIIRDPDSYQTVLSGDIDPDGSLDSYHVVGVFGSVGLRGTFLDGFIIRDGYADHPGGGWSSRGGGVLVVGAYDGERADALLRDCVIRDNYASVVGGGLASVQFEGKGGLPIAGCTFQNNYAGIGGGGIALVEVTNRLVKLVNCRFLGNQAGSGGGAIFIGQTISAKGSAHSRIVPDSTRITNCLFAENEAPQGAGILNSVADQRIEIDNCTFAENVPGAGIKSSADMDRLEIDNSIFWDNGGGQIEYAAAEVDHSCVQGGWPSGIGNIDADPLFASLAYHLHPFSPCRDAGDNGQVRQDEYDVDQDGDTDEDNPELDLNPRIAGNPPIVDMGAYEIQ